MRLSPRSRPVTGSSEPLAEAAGRPQLPSDPFHRPAAANSGHHKPSPAPQTPQLHAAASQTPGHSQRYKPAPAQSDSPQTPAAADSHQAAIHSNVPHSQSASRQSSAVRTAR